MGKSYIANSMSLNINQFSRIAAVTGARGMIGRCIVELLIAKGWFVHVLSRKRIAWDSTQVKVFVSDMNDSGVIKDFLQDAAVVFHCAAELNDETIMFDVNVKGTQTLLESMRKTATIQYFCHMSSAGVVGPTSDLIVDEDTICQPNNMYEKTKYEAEKLVLDADLAMNVCVLRPANVFDANKLGVLSYAQNHSLKDKISIFIKGYEGAHLVHAKDVAEAGLYFMDKPLMKPEVFFVSYDNDNRNTVLGVYNLYGLIQKDEKLKLPFALPNIIPYLIRKCKQGKSLHGRVRFSEKKLRAAGFEFPLGLDKAIFDVCNQSINKL